MHFVCFSFFLPCSKLESVGHSLWRKQHQSKILFSLNFETAALMLEIHAKSSNSKISECLTVNLRTVQSVFEKRWICPMMITKGYGSSEALLTVLIKKNFWICWWYPGHNWQRSQQDYLVHRDMGVFEFVIRPEAHEDICNFSYKIRKDQFLSQVTKDKKEALQNFCLLCHHKMFW